MPKFKKKAKTVARAQATVTINAGPGFVDRIIASGQEAASRLPKKNKLRVPTHEENLAANWGLFCAIVNNEIPTRKGIELLEHYPLANLRTVEAKERDNGKRSRKRFMVK